MSISKTHMIYMKRPRCFVILIMMTVKIAAEEDPNNFILMQAISANVSGQLGSAIAGGVLISIVSLFV